MIILSSAQPPKSKVPFSYIVKAAFGITSFNVKLLTFIELLSFFFKPTKKGIT